MVITMNSSTIPVKNVPKIASVVKAKIFVRNAKMELIQKIQNVSMNAAMELEKIKYVSNVRILASSVHRFWGAMDAIKAITFTKKLAF